MTNVNEIADWVRDAPKDKRWVIIMCDTFSYQDYPVYCNAVEALDRKVKDGENMQSVMECYDTHIDLKGQLAIDRCFNWPNDNRLFNDGPGTPIARLGKLLEELNKRFPNAHNPNLSDPPEPKYLAAIDNLLKNVVSSEETDAPHECPKCRELLKAIEMGKESLRLMNDTELLEHVKEHFK